MRVDVLCPETKSFDSAVDFKTKNLDDTTKMYKNDVTEDDLPQLSSLSEGDTTLSVFTGFIRLFLYSKDYKLLTMYEG